MATFASNVEVHGVILCLYKWVFDGGDRLRRFQIRVSDNPITSDYIFNGKKGYLMEELLLMLYYRGRCLLVKHGLRLNV